MDWLEAGKRLSQGEVGVLPTDTLYGIVGSALQPAVVERIYELRRRERDKPLIVLIGGWEALDALKLEVPAPIRQVLEKVWPGPVSVIVPATAPGLEYLHRGTLGLALRMPAKPALRELLQVTGPLVAPSANLAGEPPAETIAEARAYFGDEVFYVDEGRVAGSASALVDMRVDPPRVLRPAPGFVLPQ